MASRPRGDPRAARREDVARGRARLRPRRPRRRGAAPPASGCRRSRYRSVRATGVGVFLRPAGPSPRAIRARPRSRRSVQTGSRPPCLVAGCEQDRPWQAVSGAWCSSAALSPLSPNSGRADPGSTRPGQLVPLENGNRTLPIPSSWARAASCRRTPRGRRTARHLVPAGGKELRPRRHCDDDGMRRPPARGRPASCRFVPLSPTPSRLRTPTSCSRLATREQGVR